MAAAAGQVVVNVGACVYDTKKPEKEREKKCFGCWTLLSHRRSPERRDARRGKDPPRVGT